MATIQNKDSPPEESKAYSPDVIPYNSLDSEEIYIEFTTNVNPCIIRPADEVKYTYLLLPVRISSNI